MEGQGHLQGRRLRAAGHQRRAAGDGPLTLRARLARTAVALFCAAAVPVVPVGTGALVESAAAAPGDCPCVIVHLVRLDGSEQTATVDADTISGGGDLNPQGTSVRVRDGDGTTTELVRGTGITLRRMIQAVSDQLGNVSVDAITQAKIPRPRRGDATEIEPPGLGLPGANGYEEGLSPTFYIENGAANVPAFFRPLKADDATDQNNLDFLQPASGNLDLYLSTTATRLSPVIVADPDKPKAGNTVGFSVTGVDGHGSLTYTWSIDSQPASGPTPTHRWKEPGTYDVNVDVVASDGSAGTGTLAVRVGKKPKDDGGDPDGGGGNGPNTFGPNHGDGDQNGDPDGGPGTGPSGDPGAGEGAGPDGPGKQDQSGTPGRNDPEDNPLGAGDDSVSGILLTAASAPVSSSEDPAPVAAASNRASSDPPVDPLVYAAIAVPLLLLAGALSEYRLAVAAAVAGTTRRLRRRKETTMGKNA